MNIRGIHLTIIGAGPTGLEAALYGRMLGYDVLVLEQMDPGYFVRQWGHVRLFSPFGMNASPLGMAQSAGALPGEGDYLTGNEFVDRYLLPIASSPPLDRRIRTGCRVIQIGRRGALKGDKIGDPKRGLAPFRILVEQDGREKEVFTDRVLDASGIFGHPNWLGPGGTPALGERHYRTDIAYGLEDVLGSARQRYDGRRILVVGGGHSAATTVVALSRLIEESPETHVTWVLRSPGRPFDESPDDPLIERAALIRRTNAIALGDVRGVDVIRGAEVVSIQRNESDGSFIVRVTGDRTIEVDRVIANVGYGPDNSIYRELQVHECWASRGPMKIAAELIGKTGADCLSQRSPSREALLNPEPNFFIIGAKSYGKNSNYLMRVGLEQVRDVYKLLTGDDRLDLYAASRVSAGRAEG